MRNELFIHLGHLRRRFPHPFPVELICCHPNTVPAWHPFPSEYLDISLILSGRGSYRMNGKTLPVVAPCVFVKWPGLKGELGTSRNMQEILFRYSKRCCPAMRKAGMIDPSRPLWRISKASRVRALAKELFEHLIVHKSYGSADLIDRLCECLLLESQLSEPAPTDSGERKVRNMQKFVEERYLEDIEFAALAGRHGLSLSTFRRLWSKYVGVPPLRYVIQLKAQAACKMLAESDKSVKEIASSLAFKSPLYFARQFHKEIGVTATQYRKQRHHSPQSRGASTQL